MTRAFVIAALLAAACGKKEPDPRKLGLPPPILVGASGSAEPSAPALPPVDLPDAAIIRAKLGKTEVVHIDPTPEMQKAVDDYAKAKADLDEAKAHEPPPPTGTLDERCAKARREVHLTAGMPPRAPKDFPPVPQQVELCGWDKGDKGQTELWLEYAADTQQVLRYYTDAMLARGHTVEPWDPEASPTAFDFGNNDYSGSVDVERNSISITLNP